MTAKGTTAETFWTAFKALPKSEQEAIVARLLGDKEFVQYLTDVALIEHARCEPGHEGGGSSSRRRVARAEGGAGGGGGCGVDEAGYLPQSRHSFATHLLEDGYDIRTVQWLGTGTSRRR